MRNRHFLKPSVKRQDINKMSYKSQAEDLYKMLGDGKLLEAFDKFYHDKVVMQENNILLYLKRYPLYKGYPAKKTSLHLNKSVDSCSHPGFDRKWFFVRSCRTSLRGILLWSNRYFSSARKYEVYISCWWNWGYL